MQPSVEQKPSDKQPEKPSWAEKLRRYQWEGAQRLAAPPHPFRGQVLAFPPGFGKTPTALAAYRLRLFNGTHNGSSCLVVVTTALARHDWKRIAAWFWPEAKVHELGTETVYQRVGESDEDFEKRRDAGWRAMLRGETFSPSILVTSYESIPRVLDAIIADGVLLDTVVLDEAHYVKKMGTGRAQAVRPLVGRANVAILATGTPVHNRPYDLYNLLDLCALGKWGGLYTWAEKYFMVRTSERGYGRTIDELVNRARLVEDTKSVLFSASIRDAYGELPATIRKLVQVPVKGAMRVSPAKLRVTLKKKGEGAVTEALRACVKHKLKAAVELVEELDEPVVLYTFERAHAQELGLRLNKAGIKAIVATGDVPADARAKRIDEWKDGKAKALVCTMDAVRESATLTRAAAMVFVDLDWLPGKMLQCEGRIHPSRQPEGERRPARYYYLVVEGGPDEVVAEVVVEKVAAMKGLAGTSEDAEQLAATFKPVQKVVDEPSPEELLSAIVARLDAHEERMASLGL